MTYYLVGFRSEDGLFLPWRVCTSATAADKLASQQRERVAIALSFLRVSIDVVPIEVYDE